ncbi:GDYXXLXY domain-containing protein [Paenibacillus beijingensis]|uniref:Uncharacterized protein n=1 Tax=Paenibacillus beijingensis TaxID=1126833 RepID=A0A0D5NGD6_9BACL|nr:GDYXXLXY domain-containing protein [Paenibacillus beijingensis]AJY74037.1 hypothetical protein VN24_04730 [Paenibacillus beijingensis]
MLRLNMIRMGFLLGVSLVLAAIIYFFAANWSGLDRIGKVIAAAGLVVLFYGTSLAFSKFRVMPEAHAFLSNTFLIGGCISFGVAAALLGQIYNSHADSYGLFLVWAIPALLLAWITRYHPFILLSYALIHLALWFYFFPTSLNIDYSDGKTMLIGGMFALINLILFVLAEMKRLAIAPLKFVSFIIFHISLLQLTNSFEFEDAGLVMNIPCAAAIGFGFYYFIRIRLNKMYVTLNALAASAFAVFKFVELANSYASSAFFVFGLVFVALLLTGNVLFFRYLNRLGAQPSEAGETTPDTASDDRSSDIVSKAVSTIVTVIGVIIGSISLVGLVLLVWENDNPQVVLYVLSLLFVTPMIVLNRLNPVIRYTLLTIGYIAGIVAVVWDDRLALSLLFLILSIAGWLRLQGTIPHFFTYALLNLNIGIIFSQVLETSDREYVYAILLLAILNAALYASRSRLPEGPLKTQLKTSGLFFTLLFLFWLTFFDDIFPYSYAFFNVVYFGAVTLLLFLFLRRSQAADAAISLAFWFVFIAFKYYDLLWSLLDKSVTLAVLGIVTLTVTYIIARRTGTDGENGERGSFMRQSPVLIALVVILQLAFLGYQTAKSESLLANGVSIKLEMAPLDPRSLLQGDYVLLNYVISTPPDSAAKELANRSSRSKVKVVLAPDQRGVHVFNRLYKSGEALEEGEVVINGKLSSSFSIHYGIETYFVPEGTGIETQRDARFAYIRIGAGGDALLERLAKQ